MTDERTAVPTGFDMDTSELAASLHTLADAIENGDVALRSVGTDKYVPCGDPIEHSITLDYSPGTFETADVVDDIVMLKRATTDGAGCRERPGTAHDYDGGEP